MRREGYVSRQAVEKSNIGRCGAEGAFLAGFVEKNVFREGAKQRARFFLSLYLHKVCFFILPFSLERKRKKQGEPTNGSPLTPFQRSTGTLSPSIAPAQWEGLDVSHQAVVRTAPRGRRATAALG